nr:hypothetical protein [Tanacetum cinerariifolium]
MSKSLNPLSSPIKDTSAPNAIPIPTSPSLSILSMASPTFQDKWSKDKHIKLVNIIDFLSEEEPKKVSKALKHPGEAFTRTPNQYKEYMSEFWYTSKTLKNSKVWFSTPTEGIIGETVREWFLTIGYSGEIKAKGTLKKYLLPSRWRLLMGQIIQCLESKTSRFDQISNNDAIILYCLANGVDIDYARLIWVDLINKLNKKTREKVVMYLRFLSLLLEHKMEGYEADTVTLNPTQIFSVHNWSLKKNQPEGPPFTAHMLAICNVNEPVAFKAPKTSSKDEKKSSLAKDSNASQPLAFTDVVARLHKENQQATSGPTSLGVTSKERVNPQPRTNPSVLVNKTKSAGHRLKIAHTASGTNKESSNAKKEASYDSSEFKTSPEFTSFDKNTKDIKLEDLSKLMPNVETLNHKLVKEKEEAEIKDALLKAKLSFPNAEQLTELLVNSLKPKLSKLLSSYDFSNSLPTKLKELPSKFKDITGEIRELKKYVAKLEIELPMDLKEIPTKLEKFSSTVLSQDQDLGCSSKSSQQGEPIKNKGNEAMTYKETKEEESETKVRITSFMVKSSKKKKLKKFNSFTKKGDHVHFTKEQIKEQKRIEESVKADMAKKEEVAGKEELIDLRGIDVVTNVYKAKIKYDKYYDKLLNKRVQSRIINCDVLTKKGPITLKVYKDDRTNEVILNFKASDLHLSERRKVMQACPKRTEAGWTTIYKQIKTRMDNLHKTEHELGIDFNKPLGEQDPLEKLNELAKRRGNMPMPFKTTSGLQRDFGDLTNKMLYTVQEISDFIKDLGLMIMPRPSVPSYLLKLTKGI